MALKKSVLVKVTRVPAEFHKVTNVSLSRDGITTTLSVSSFYTQEASEAGAQALAQTSFTVRGLPETGEDVWIFAETRLAAAAPDDAPISNELVQFEVQNQYVFAGAEIV